jgi:tRNA A37 threonylcarbamoyladenosine dehydratase
VDFDYVTLSSLNRHATAGAADVGTPKVKCIEKTLRSISQWVEVDCRIDIWRKEDGGSLLEGADWVVGSSPVYTYTTAQLTALRDKTLLITSPQKLTS